MDGIQLRGGRYKIEGLMIQLRECTVEGRTSPCTVEGQYTFFGITKTKASVRQWCSYHSGVVLQVTIN